MIKNILIGLSLIVAQSAFADVLRVDIFGKMMLPNFKDVDALNRLIGDMVANQEIKRFEIVGIGIEGGYAACIEPLLPKNLEKIQERLTAMQVDTKNTAYRVQKVSECK